MANKYIAFISYRHAELDSAIAKTLHSLIEQYRIPRGIRKDGEARLGVVFRDQEELHAASDLSSEIQTALNSTEYLIVICSKNSVESPWVTREVDHFLQNHDRSQVFTVLASGEPMEVFPPQLTRTPDGEPIEPLAVDIRSDTIAGSRKKLKKELPRLISAILQCPYDALVMREQKRKNRRVLSIASGIMAILLGFTSMVLLKNQQIALANDQLEVKNTQLNQANVALEEQKAAVQLRESQLLVQSALEDLGNADYYSAMQKAVDALPADASDNRPYYAPAEQVLMDAMGIFRTADDSVSLNTTVLEQVTDISDFVITGDGTRVVTTDEFGTLFCFDANSGQQLWYQYAPQEDTGLTSVAPYLFLCNEDQTVIRSGKKILCAYDVATGDPVWTLDAGNIAEDYLFYHKERNVLIYVSSYAAGIFNSAYKLVEVDASEGRILQEIPFFESSSSFACSFSGYFTRGLSKGGRFYNNGTRFCGAFFDDRQYLQCFDADLTQGTCHIVYTSTEPLLTGAAVAGVFRDLENGMYVICADVKEDSLFTALKIDAQTGNLLWLQDVPYPSTMHLRLSDDVFTLGMDSGILIGCSNNFFLLDLQTGATVCNKTTPSDITSLAFLPTGDFAFSLKDGTYAIGWVMKNDGNIMLTTEQSWQSFAELEPHTSLQAWGGGIVQLYTDNDMFMLGVGNHACPGSVLVIPAQQENTLQIVRPTQALTLNDLIPIQMPENDFRLFSDATAYQVGSSLVIGKCYRSNSSGNAQLFLDPATRQVVETFNYTNYYSDGTLFWLPDTRQPLTCYSYDGIALINDDGTETVLYDTNADQDALGEKYEWWPSISLFRCESAYQVQDGSLLSAACNPETLQLWRNGVPTVQANLPEALMTTPEESTKTARLLKVSPSGYILVSLHGYEDVIPLENIQAYNSAENTWTSFRSNAVFSDSNAIAFAEDAALMAGIDQNGTVRLLDLDTGNTVGRFATQLPAGSVLQMRFFLDDTHLAIKASGGHLLIYDLATGTQVYRDQLNDAYASTLQIFEDPAHGRLYVNGGSKSGLCLDRDSWTVLAKLDNLLYYDSSADIVYLTAGSSSNSPIVYGAIPDTQTLVNLAKEALANH